MKLIIGLVAAALASGAIAQAVPPGTNLAHPVTPDQDAPHSQGTALVRSHMSHRAMHHRHRTRHHRRHHHVVRH